MRTRLVCACAALFLAGGAPADARSGPALLYAQAPASPLLARSALFRAAPLLVSGTDAYRRGEYLYQDYLFDDHGADTTPGLGASANWGSQPVFAPAAGDLEYPPGERYRNNAADLVEFRVRPTREAIAYRITLNTVVARDAAVVGIGIDTDRSGGQPVAWPFGAGVTSTGLDRFITAWGTGGSVTDLRTGSATRLPAGAVRMSLRRHQMTVKVPRSILDPGRATWRHVVGTGLWDGQSWLGAQAGGARVFNLGFRFAEPVGSVPGTAAGLPGYTTAPGTGSWFEDGQARDLGAGTTGAAHADVDFGALERRGSKDIHAPGRSQARIYASRIGIAAGVDHAAFPEFGGSLQPYLVTFPEDYRADRRTPVLFALHPSNSGYQPFSVFMPHWAAQLGRHRLVVTPLSRGLNGPDVASGAFTGAAEADFFEAWADLGRHFSLDRGHTILGGYSLGAYADYHLAELWPDLFAAVFSVVGTAPTNGRDTEMLANLHWIPVLAWNQADDALVPYADASATAGALTDLGLRHEQWTFAAGNHLAPALRDDWTAAAARLGDPEVRSDPPRVDFAYYPSLDDRGAGLVHDHAYWISGLRLADAEQPSPELARGDVTARSLAFGEGDAPSTGYTDTALSGGSPAAIAGVRWGTAPQVPPANELDLELHNLRRLAVDGRAARLSGHRPLTIRAHSEAPAVLRLTLATGTRTLRLAAGDSVVRLQPRG